MLNDGAYSYAYNAESEIKSAAGVNYTGVYPERSRRNGDGNRVEKSSGKIYWLALSGAEGYGAGTEILDESDLSGNITNEYVFFGGKRIAMRNVSSGTIYYYEDDMLGSARTKRGLPGRRLVEPGGLVQAGQTSPCYDGDFYPFGGERIITNTCTQNYKFEGKERDTETGNDDFGARYYTSRVGRRAARYDSGLTAHKYNRPAHKRPAPHRIAGEQIACSRSRCGNLSITPHLFFHREFPAPMNLHLSPRSGQPPLPHNHARYDKIYELTQVIQGVNTTENYSYDPVGNRLSSLGVSSYTNNTSNELTSTSAASYTYDSNGNTTSKTDSTGTTNYTWDFENRLTQVTLPGTGGTVQFRYDPFGRRIEKVFTQGTNTTTTNYLYDSVDSIEEIDQSGNVFAKYARTTNIDELLAESRSGATSFYEADGLGSVTSLTSGAGALAQTYTYDSFGKVVTSSGNATNAFRYAGREFDTETNLYYYRARYYDPTIARFLSEDPVRFGAGINFYAYVKNEPIDFVDPYGLKCEQLTPWKEVPRMTSPNALKPYSTVQGGLFWVPGTWDFVGGDGSSSCICEWVATHVRKRKLYRERIEEQAWFQCTDSCGKPEPAKVQTRTGTRHWETDEPGWPLWSPQTTYVSGPTVQLSGSSHPGGDPNKFNTQCLACSLVYRP